jgi:hypothetical protein
MVKKSGESGEIEKWRNFCQSGEIYIYDIKDGARRVRGKGACVCLCGYLGGRCCSELWQPVPP